MDIGQDVRALPSNLSSAAMGENGTTRKQQHIETFLLSRYESIFFDCIRFHDWTESQIGPSQKFDTRGGKAQHSQRHHWTDGFWREAIVEDI
jgi:hypothetical protein